MAEFPGEVSVPVTVYFTMPPVQLTLCGATTTTEPAPLLKSGDQFVSEGASMVLVGTTRISVADGDCCDPFLVNAVKVQLVPAGRPVGRCTSVSGEDAGTLTVVVKPSVHATST